MITIDLNGLQKAKALIDLANSVPLGDVEWQRDGVTIQVPKHEIDDWKYMGLSNVYFAYDYLMTPNVKVSGSTPLHGGESAALPGSTPDTDGETT